MQCPQCSGAQWSKAGRDRQGRQMSGCSACLRRQSERSVSAFCCYRSPDEIIALAVRWYLRFRLSYADVTELLAERGIHVDPSTLFDWVQQFTPLYQEAARSRRHVVGRRWSVDETYMRFADAWCSASRALDEHDQVASGPPWQRGGPVAADRPARPGHE